MPPPVLMFLGFVLFGTCLVAFATGWPWLVLLFKWYVQGPLKNRRESEFPARRQFTAVSRDALPPDEVTAHAAAERQLVAQGYTLAAHFVPALILKYTQSSVSLWLQPLEKAMALVMAVRVKRPDFPARANDFCTLHTLFVDGSSVETTNAGREAFPPDPACDMVRWPGMFDLSVLHRLHVARVALFRRGRDATLPPPEHALQFLQEQEQMGHLHRARSGHLWFDAGQDAFRLTLKGAASMRWKLLWPWKQRLASRHERRLRRVLAEVGMGTPEQYAPHPKDAEAPPGLSYESGARPERACPPAVEPVD